MNGTFLVGCFAVTTLIGGTIPFTVPSVERKTDAPAAESSAPQLQQTVDPCLQQTWPYYQGACVRDGRQPTGRAHNVRVVSAGRPQPAK